MIGKIVLGYVEWFFYANGPKPMVDAMETILKTMGLPKKQKKC
jgi:hypothetical protein